MARGWKRLSQPSKDGISSRHCQCAARWLRCMRGKHLALELLPLNFWQRSQKGREARCGST